MQYDKLRRRLPTIVPASESISNAVSTVESLPQPPALAARRTLISHDSVSIENVYPFVLHSYL